ncbi:MAG: glycosyltransferase family 2 protein [Lachnospiraceae bacterium]|nr:glycosyltransferase family 2 protein [Lachnospiraceae bacterium]
MTTFSLCMIVKNEAAILERCLDSVADIMDEIIIVDTGSTDATREIAQKYTNKVFDFPWVDDFSLARNFAFEKATCDYIYSADADEVLDAKNHDALKDLKTVMMHEVEIVTMWYVESGVQTVLNAKRERRPKLYKRLRKFVWIDPVHETVRLDPVVYDSDIEIFHKPVGNHSARDFSIFETAYATQGRLSKKLYKMYARELYKWGDAERLAYGARVFRQVMADEQVGNDLFMMLSAVIVRAERLMSNNSEFMKYAMKVISLGGCSEVCVELGDYYRDKGDYSEAAVWYYNACYETESVLDIRSSGSEIMLRLSDCYEKLGDGDLSAKYLKAASEWQMPKES